MAGITEAAVATWTVEQLDVMTNVMSKDEKERQRQRVLHTAHTITHVYLLGIISQTIYNVNDSERLTEITCLVEIGGVLLRCRRAPQMDVCHACYRPSPDRYPSSPTWTERTLAAQYLHSDTQQLNLTDKFSSNVDVLSLTNSTKPRHWLQRRSTIVWNAADENLISKIQTYSFFIFI